jgi:hypothetical protein
MNSRKRSEATDGIRILTAKEEEEGCETDGNIKCGSLHVHTVPSERAISFIGVVKNPERIGDEIGSMIHVFFWTMAEEERFTPDGGGRQSMFAPPEAGFGSST